MHTTNQKNHFLIDQIPKNQINYILQFLQYLYTIGKRGKGASEVIVGIKQIYIFHEKSPQIFDHPVIKQGMKSLKYSNQEAKDQIKSLNENKELPFTVDLLEQLRALYWNENWGCEDIDQKSIYLAAAICLDSGIRIGQITLCDGKLKTDHCIRAKEVHLFVKEESNYLSAGLKFRQEFFLKQWSISDVVQINLNFLTNKTTSSTQTLVASKPCCLLRRTTLESQLVNDIVEWIINSQVNEEDELLCRYWNGKRKVVTRKSVANSLKFIGSLNQLPTHRINTRSLRKGFASNGSVNGALNQQMLCERGGWKIGSKTIVKHYVTEFKNHGLLSVSGSADAVSINDLKRLVK